MNTFLPFPSLRESASCLDNKRLKNQLNECQAIKKALFGGEAWAMHPATLMWKEHSDALSLYMVAVAEEMKRRGFSIPKWTPVLSYASEASYRMPPWFGCPIVHKTHRQNLLRKDFQYYKPYFLEENSGSDVYAWPIKQSNGIWIIRFKQVGAKKYQDRTELISP